MAQTQKFLSLFQPSQLDLKNKVKIIDIKNLHAKFLNQIELTVELKVFGNKERGILFRRRSKALFKFIIKLHDVLVLLSRTRAATGNINNRKFSYLSILFQQIRCLFTNSVY